MKRTRILFGLTTFVCVLAYACNYTQANSEQTDVLEVSDTTAQVPTTTQHTVGLDTFEIEKLSLPKNLLTERKSSELFEFMESQFFPYDGKIEATCQLPSHLVSGGQNAFLNSLVKAYNDHRPFVISPDIIWALISQGFARHISFNGEKYRNKLVSFDNKMTLSVEARDYIRLGDPKSNWDKAINQLIQKGKPYIKKEAFEQLTGTFSTTTALEKTVHQITLLETLKGFFNYEIDGAGCGLPRIIIKGTLEDWEKVREKTNYIAQYDLSWWTKRLDVILEQIIQAKKGQFNASFWRNMIKYRKSEEYGDPSRVTGWILDFYPYDISGKRSAFKEIDYASFLLSELIQVPFVFTDKQLNLRMDMKLVAGFVGATQNKKDYSITPQLGWFVVSGKYTAEEE